MPANLFKLTLTAAFSLSFLLSLIAVYVNDQFSVLVSEDSVFTIEPGSTVSGITKRLTVDGLLPVNNIAFKTVALLTRGEGSIQAGQYQLKAGMPSQEVLALFRSGKVIATIYPPEISRG
jgi:cell division protein YceG involved in septum cleavage